LITTLKRGLTEGPSERIERMVAASRIRGANQPPDEGIFSTAKGDAYEAYAHLTIRERQARSLASGFDALPVYLFPEERLVGMVYHLGGGQGKSAGPDWSAEGNKEVARRFNSPADVSTIDLFGGGAGPGHVTWHWDWILQKGIIGLLDEYREALKTPKDQTAKEFYEGVIIVWESVLRWAERHVVALEKALAEASADDKPRLEELIKICRQVPAYPARNFREATQAFLIQYLAVMRECPFGGNGPGRVDYFLWPYLKKDLEDGRCTLQEARELIDELLMRIEERIQGFDGWVEAIVLGGSNPDGTSAVNPLSHIFVESIIELDQTHPSVYMRMPSDPPQDYIELAARYLLDGRNRAQILNDPVISAALQKVGLTSEDSMMYTCGGCMEIVPQGMNSDLLFAATHSVPLTLELVITGGEAMRLGKRLEGVNLKPLPAYADFEEFYAAFAKELEREQVFRFRQLDVFSETMAEHRPTYLQSSMIADCFERGRDQQDGGARYHHYGVDPLGIANTADALHALKRAVYEDKLCTSEELLAAIIANYEGFETLRLKLRSLPKYGQQDAGADAMTKRLWNTLTDIYMGYRNRFGGRVKMVIFTFMWAPWVGDQLSATADGQFAGTPISQGITPANASMTEGITAAIGSMTTLDLANAAGGASSMWDLDPQWATPEVTGAIVRSFLKMGGQIFQGNTTDVEELIKAKSNPEAYKHLVVRVGGFSARFVGLPEDVQDDVINRHRHKG
jgi:formate C-acetyltransferase